MKRLESGLGPDLEVIEPGPIFTLRMMTGNISLIPNQRLPHEMAHCNKNRAKNAHGLCTKSCRKRSVVSQINDNITSYLLTLQR